MNVPPSYHRRVDPQGPSELPIFELPLAIVPAEQVPLHIFEERYRLMIAHCLEDGTPFGIVLRDDSGARAIGCTASVAEVLERYDDGRLDIIVTGGEPFRVLDRFDADDWPAAQVEMLPPESGGAEAHDPLLLARAAFAELLTAVGAQPERAEAAADAYTIAAQIEMPPGEKQALLECDGEGERLVSLEGSLRKLIAGLKRSRELAERAKSNGHGQGRIGPLPPPE
jgi:Lon protease-like protein